ncbi:hypothetical protein EUX98_g8501 [Antrodiella citrinella]|uniref:Uncharacterized protein n=1 Tax=Antrodiella citrinella TaxID=2447956 RepID=A0A4S4M6H4_9APHY|nr:hypothetical protein EUX98_g8501 [Antrodiella citrinella]
MTLTAVYISVKLDPKTGKVCLDKANGPSVIERFIACTERGFQLHQLGNLSHVLSLESDPFVVSFAKQVAFVDQGSTVVSGTDVGKAVVYSAETGKRVQDLVYPQGGLVQPVAACDLQDVSLIAMAGSTRGSVKETSSSSMRGGRGYLPEIPRRFMNLIGSALFLIIIFALGWYGRAHVDGFGPSVHRLLDLVGLPSETSYLQHLVTSTYAAPISITERAATIHPEHVVVVSIPPTSVLFADPATPVTQFVTELQVVTTVITELPPATTTIRHVVTIRETLTISSTVKSLYEDPTPTASMPTFTTAVVGEGAHPGAVGVGNVGNEERLMMRPR